LAAALGHNLPECHLVGIRAHDMDFGDELSAETARAVSHAEKIVIEMVKRAPALAGE
jgi:hypothetical protein